MTELHEDEKILIRRFWVIKNFDWLMEEASFQKELRSFNQETKIEVWNWDAEKGEAKIL